MPQQQAPDQSAAIAAAAKAAEKAAHRRTISQTCSNPIAPLSEDEHGDFSRFNHEVMKRIAVIPGAIEALQDKTTEVKLPEPAGMGEPQTFDDAQFMQH